jgi:hypothetical protein
MIMGEFDVIYLLAVVIATIIMFVLSIISLSLGKLIENTPDGRELRGECVKDGKGLSSPRSASRLFVLGLSIVFVIGIVILLLSNASKIIMIIGGVTMFAALLFSATIVIFELIIYNTMRSQMKSVKMVVV